MKFKDLKFNRLDEHETSFFYDGVNYKVVVSRSRSRYYLWIKDFFHEFPRFNGVVKANDIVDFKSYL